jgi:hypothetical protein
MKPRYAHLRCMEHWPVLGFFQACLLSRSTSLPAEMVITARPPDTENRQVQLAHSRLFLGKFLEYLYAIPH